MKKRKPGLFINQEKICLLVNKAMEKKAFNEFSVALQKEDIILDYSKSKFTSKGRLKSLNVTVKFGETEVGKLRAPWLALQFFDFGFEKYKIENAPYSFRVGKM